MKEACLKAAYETFIDKQYEIPSYLASPFCPEIDQLGDVANSLFSQNEQSSNSFLRLQFNLRSLLLQTVVL
jgi:hypothetical protein